VLCGALVLGWGPFPELGIIGAGISYVFCFGVATLYFAFHILTGRKGLRLDWRALQPSMNLIKDILGVGLLSSFNTIQTIATAVIITGLVGSFGTAALAGYGLGVRLELLQVPIIFAIGSALVPLVGVNIGAKNIHRARRISWAGAGLAACVTGSIGITVSIWPGLWAGLFSGEAAVLEVAFRYLRIVGPCYLFLGIGLALYFASQGAGKVLWPMLAGSSRFIIAAGGGLIVIRYLSGTLASLFLLIGLGMFALGAGAAVAIWRRVLREPDA
jgi:Na+-driven multidrug efflux pump